ncbi:MAG TPA: ribosomal protein S18-alanine N-acetyltransferase [Candidatus Methanoperedens sp.]
MIIIRKFEPCDFPAVIDIERKVFNEHDPYYYMQFYETCSDSFIVAQINGLLVGYIVGFQASEETGRIFSFAVSLPYRNRGIGSALLKEIINIFTKAGVLRIILEVRSGNASAIRFYERHGFHKVGVAENYYNDGESAVLMEFQISYRGL